MGHVFPNDEGRMPFVPGARTLTRRSFFRAAAAVSLGGLLASCDLDDVLDRAGETVVPPTSSPVEDWDAWWSRKQETGRLLFANWPYYIDLANGERRSLDLFTDETGINVEYFRPIVSNEGFFEEIAPYLEAGLPLYWDLIVMTNGPYVTKLVNEGWLTPLDHSRLPTFDRHASDLVRDPLWDPGNRHSVAWQSGLTGIAYRAEAVEALGRTPRSIGDLFDPALAGRVGMLNDLQDLGSFGLLANDVDPGGSTESDWLAAAETLREQRAAGVVRDYRDQSYLRALQRGDVWLSQAWSGDVFQAQQAGDALEFVVPDEGGMFWTDHLMIPAGAKHPADALAFMDFVYRPEIAALIADWVWYISPVPAARDIVANDLGDPAVADSPLVFPTVDPAGTEAFKEYRVFENEDEADAWASIFGAVPFGL
jgi:spermidine/putrescine transport system substrate-binding protein